MIIRLITSGTKERKLLSSQGFWKGSLGDAIDYFHARRSTLTRISLFVFPGMAQWVTCMENDTENIPCRENEERNGKLSARSCYRSRPPHPSTLKRIRGEILRESFVPAVIH